MMRSLLPRMASSLSLCDSGSGRDSEQSRQPEPRTDLPIPRYFLYKLLEKQKDVGYKKLLQDDIVTEAQQVLLDYLDLPANRDPTPPHQQQGEHPTPQ